VKKRNKTPDETLRVKKVGGGKRSGGEKSAKKPWGKGGGQHMQGVWEGESRGRILKNAEEKTVKNLKEKKRGGKITKNGSRGRRLGFLCTQKKGRKEKAKTVKRGDGERGRREGSLGGAKRMPRTHCRAGVNDEQEKGRGDEKSKRKKKTDRGKEE